MLPRQIAVEIQMKKRVVAEKIESCTIYHSDIVDFTNIVNESAPLEVSSPFYSFKKLHCILLTDRNLLELLVQVV